MHNALPLERIFSLSQLFLERGCHASLLKIVSNKERFKRNMTVQEAYNDYGNMTYCNCQGDCCTISGCSCQTTKNVTHLSCMNEENMSTFIKLCLMNSRYHVMMVTMKTVKKSNKENLNLLDIVSY